MPALACDAEPHTQTTPVQIVTLKDFPTAASDSSNYVRGTASDNPKDPHIGRMGLNAPESHQLGRYTERRCTECPRIPHRYSGAMANNISGPSIYHRHFDRLRADRPENAPLGEACVCRGGTRKQDCPRPPTQSHGQSSHSAARLGNCRDRSACLNDHERQVPIAGIDPHISAVNQVGLRFIYHDLAVIDDHA